MNDIRAEQASPAPLVSVGAVSKTGLRDENQDSMTAFSSPFGTAYLVADGMGGHRGGAEASRMVAQSFTRHLLAVPPSSPIRDAITLAARLTNIELLEKGKSGAPEFEGMGSTVAVALLRQNGDQVELTTAHVGDSRIYLERNGVLRQLTKDHTQVQWLLDTKAIDEAAARNHPDASVLTRALGHTTDLQVDVSDPIPIFEDDGILLCSDGLSGFAGSEDIERAIQGNPDPSACANQLVELALASGSNDNITVQFLRIGNVARSAARARRKASRNGGRLVPASSAPSASRRKTNVLLPVLLILTILALSGIAAWWYRSHRSGSDDGIANLEKNLKQLEAEATKCKDRAGADSKSVDGVVSKLSGPEGSKLKQDFKNLGKEFNLIAGDAGNIHDVAADKYTKSLQSLRQSGSSTEQRRNSRDLLTNIQASAKEIDHKNHELDDLEQRKVKLEDQVPTQAQPEQSGSNHRGGATPAPARSSGRRPEGKTDTEESTH